MLREPRAKARSARLDETSLATFARSRTASDAASDWLRHVSAETG